MFVSFGTIGRCRCGAIAPRRTFWRHLPAFLSRGHIEARVGSRVVGVIDDTAKARHRVERMYASPVTFVPALTQQGSWPSTPLPQRYRGYYDFHFGGEPLCDVCVKGAREFCAIDPREADLRAGAFLTPDQRAARRDWLDRSREREIEAKDTQVSSPYAFPVAPPPPPPVRPYPGLSYSEERQLYVFKDGEDKRRPPTDAQLTKPDEEEAA